MIVAIEKVDARAKAAAVKVVAGQLVDNPYPSWHGAALLWQEYLERHVETLKNEEANCSADCL